MKLAYFDQFLITSDTMSSYTDMEVLKLVFLSSLHFVSYRVVSLRFMLSNPLLSLRFVSFSFATVSDCPISDINSHDDESV